MTVLVFEFFGRDNTAGRTLDSLRGKTDSAGNRLRGLGRDADDASGPVQKLANVVDFLRARVVGAAGALAKGGLAVGVFASTTVSAASLLAPYVAQAAHWIGLVGKNAGAASPMLLGMAASGGVLLLAMKAIGPSILESLTPISDKFDAIRISAGNLAQKGLTDLASGFAKANFPAVSLGMDMIAVSTNRVVTRFLEWGKSAAGVRTIHNVMEATAKATDVLGPKLSRLIESFGNMIGRIVGVSTAAGASGLGGVLEKLADWMDRVNEATVQAGLDGLKERYREVKVGVQQLNEMLQSGRQFWTEYRTEIGLAQDAIAIVAIAFGGPVIATAAAVALIIRHWDELKAAKDALTNHFKTDTGILTFMEFLRSGVAVVTPSIVGAFNTIWEAIGPRLSRIWQQITQELIPALGAFWNAISPIVAIIADVLGPIVASVFSGIVQAISGAISIITGILNVFAGLLTGDWSRLWEGVKQILRGAWDAIVGLLNVFIFGKILGLLGRLPSLIGGKFNEAGNAAWRAVGDMGGAVLRALDDLVGRIPGALGGAINLLYQAGRNIVQGLINGILSMINAAGSAMASVARRIRDMLPFSPAKAGPLSGGGSPDLAGAKIAAMVAGGMIRGVPQVVGAAYQLAGAARLGMPAQSSLVGGAVAMAGRVGAGGAIPPIVIQGDGSRLVEYMLELLRKAVSDRGGSVQGVLGR